MGGSGFWSVMRHIYVFGIWYNIDCGTIIIVWDRWINVQTRAGIFNSRVW